MKLDSVTQTVMDEFRGAMKEYVTSRVRDVSLTVSSAVTPARYAEMTDALAAMGMKWLRVMHDLYRIPLRSQTEATGSSQVEERAVAIDEWWKEFDLLFAQIRSVPLSGRTPTWNCVERFFNQFMDHRWRNEKELANAVASAEFGVTLMLHDEDIRVR